MLKTKNKYYTVHYSALIMFFLIFFTSCFGGGGGIRKAKNFRMDAPSNWVVGDKEGSDESFRLPSGALSTFSSSCDRNADAPLPVLTRHLFFDLKKVEITNQHPFESKNQKGLYTSIKAFIDKTPIYMDTFVTTKNNCIYDFTLSSRKPLKESETNEFVKLIESFEYGSD